MKNKNNNTVQHIKVKSVQPRYINLNEDIFAALNIYETRVYLALRYQADYRRQLSDVQLTVDELIKISKVKRSTLFKCLSTLENVHFLINRVNWDKKTWGQANEYEVAHNLYYFKPIEIEESEENPPDVINNNGITNGSYIEGVHVVDYIVHEVDDIVHEVDTPKKIKQNEYKETYYQKNEANKTILSLENLFQNNPHDLPQDMIEDWVTNRKAKRTPVTRTAWNRLNKELFKCKNPIEAFEECVSSGWLSLKADWINKSNDKKGVYDHTSTEWAKGFETDVF
jgi:hypothetical protein